MSKKVVSLVIRRALNLRQEALTSKKVIVCLFYYPKPDLGAPPNIGARGWLPPLTPPSIRHCIHLSNMPLEQHANFKGLISYLTLFTQAVKIKAKTISV